MTFKQLLAKTQRICQRHNSQLTNLRVHILKLMWQSKTPIKAYDLLRRVNSDIGAVEPPTVYRALNFLLKHHLVHKIHANNTYIICAHAHACSDSCHSNSYLLICSQCGHAEEHTTTAFSKPLQSITKKHRFAQEPHAPIEISGRCHACAS